MLIREYEKRYGMYDFIHDDEMEKRKRKQILLTNRIRNKMDETKDLYEMQVFLSRFIDLPSFFVNIGHDDIKNFSECPLTDEEADNLGLDLLTWDKTHFLTKDCDFIRMTEISEWRNAAKEEDEK